MENQNITMNEEVMEVAEELIPERKNGMKFVGGSLLAVGIAGAIYGGYRLVKKLKSKKDSKYSEIPEQDEEVYECVEGR